MPDPTVTEALAHLGHAAREWRDHSHSFGSLSAVDSASALIDAAVDCLVAGVDSTALRELAGASPGTAESTLGPLLEDTLRELDILDENAPAGVTVGIEGLRDFLALVLEDARHLGAHLDLEADIRLDPAFSLYPHAPFLVLPDRSRMLHFGERDHTPAEELALVADSVHEWIVEELASHDLPTSWPPCPLHPATHSLWVRCLEDEVVWACPSTGAAQARVGELTS